MIQQCRLQPPTTHFITPARFLLIYHSFEPLPISITSSTHLSIAVPSRLYSTPPTPQKPLSGLRIGVKDIIDLSGVPTSYQSRAYLALRRPPPRTSASAIKALIDKGAVVVGKTRTTQFAAGEQASGDWVDFLAPWNPRGDGWLVPGMSSAGSASAVAGYGWVDGAVGSDSGFPSWCEYGIGKLILVLGVDSSGEYDGACGVTGIIWE